MKSSLLAAVAALSFAASAVAQTPCSTQPLPPNYGGRAPPPCAPYGPPPQYGPGNHAPGYGYRAPAPNGYGASTPNGYGASTPNGYGAPAPNGYGAPRPPATTPESGGEKESADDDEFIALYLDLLSIRVGTHRIRGSDADADTWGFLFALDPDVVTTSGYFSKRSTWFAAIGGGTDGLEGQLESTSRAGVRGYFGDDHGPFARIGLGFQFLGNNKLYRSQFELPMMDVGYQLMNDAVLIEIAATGSLVLGGRYYTGDHAERRIDTEPSLGALFTVQAEPLRIHATAQRIFAGQTGPGTPIDQVQAQLCAGIVEPVFLCAHAAFHRGDIELPGGGFRESTVSYFGGTLGLGLIQNRAGSL